MDPRLPAALLAGKTATILSRRLGIGGGTTFPGTVVRWFDPGATSKMARALALGSVVVTGTNGKTTTSRLIGDVLRAAGLRPVHNRTGANLIGGVTSALMAATTVDGRPRADIGLFEVDEAVLPAIIREAKPKVVLINNLFRDQLDRYGEVNYLAKIWREGLAQLPSDATVVLNADDPLVASLGESIPARVLYFGLEDESQGMRELPHAADSKSCLHCGSRLEYSIVYYGHMGKYTCPTGDSARPMPQVRAQQVRMHGVDGSEMMIETPRGTLALTSPMPGLYNLYNTLAAVACCEALSIEHQYIASSVRAFSAAFGRIERVEIGGKHVFLALVKNPIGFGEVLRTVLAGDDLKNLMIIINDKFADGTDVSWLWDVDFELLAGKANFVITSGLRGEDMSVRLKYAGVEPDRIVLEKDLGAALQRGLERTAAGDTLYVLPTYTAMLEIRDVMRRLGHVGRFWED